MKFELGTQKKNGISFGNENFMGGGLLFITGGNLILNDFLVADFTRPPSNFINWFLVSA